MAATSGVGNAQGEFPPVKKIPSKMDQRLSEYWKFFSKNRDIPDLRIEWLFEDHEAFRKRFEKVPKQVLGYKEFAAYSVMVIVVAGTAYFVVKLFRSTNAKL